MDSSSGSVSGADLRLDQRRRQGQVLQWLKKAGFKSSNRKGYGPTPEIVLVLCSPPYQNAWASFGFWSGGTFETQARHLDPRSQFLVESEPLGKWLREKFATADR